MTVYGAFKKVFIPAGQVVTVQLQFQYLDMSYYDEQAAGVAVAIAYGIHWYEG